MRASSISRTTFLQAFVCVAFTLISLLTPRIGDATVFSSSVSLSPVIDFPPPPNSQPGYEIQTWTQPNNTGSGAYLGLTISNLVLSAYAYTIGIGQEWYSVTNGTVFTPSTRLSLTPFANNLAPPFTPGQIQLSVGQDFYLAFLLQVGPQRCGWAHLELTSPTTLALLGNAIEDTGSGIIVGTTSVVPEPSAMCLTALTSILLLLRSRPRR